MAFRWNPNNSQRELYEEWRKQIVNYLVASREGCNIRSIPKFFEETIGEDIPLMKMGFSSLNHLLYAMQDDIEVRKIDFKLFVFIRESAVPSYLADLRKMVLGQAKDKSCKSKTGVIRRPTKSQSVYCRAAELLTSAPYRPSTARINNTPTSSRSSNFSRPQQSNYQQQRPPLSRNPLPGYKPMNNFQHSTQSPKPSSTSASSTTKSIPAPSCHLVVPQKEDSWDDWSTPSTTLYKSVSSAPPRGALSSSKSQGPARYRNLPGLVDEDDFDGYSDDSEVFDYYSHSGPILSSKSKITKMSGEFNVTVANPPAVTRDTSNSVTIKPAVSATTNDTSSSKSADSREEVDSSSASSINSIAVKAAPVCSSSVPSEASKQVISVATSAVVMKKVEKATPTSNTAAPLLNGLHSLTRIQNAKPLKGLNLDSKNVLFQYQSIYPEDKHALARIMLDVRKIKFPAFFFGETRANQSLKTYLTSMSMSL